MSIFAIGDLHLPGRDDKPMDVFGIHWDRHFESIRENWQKLVQTEDIVLIPGDISWAMHLVDALPDLESIAALPGQKILLKGNHDYWWSTIQKVRSALPTNMHALQNDSITMEDTVFCGTRGWTLPSELAPLNAQEEKIFKREVGRLRMSLEHAAQEAKGKRLMALMHFPPLLADGKDTDFSMLLEQAGVTDVVYGHLHGNGIKNGFMGVHGGVRYHLTSCDAIGFSPLMIAEDHG